MRAHGGHAAVVWDGPAALVPLLCERWVPDGIRPPGWRPGTFAAGFSSPGKGAGGAVRTAPGRDPVTGKPPAAAMRATVAHCETVLRSFYDFHLEAGTGPMVNPFPLARGRRGRANAHRSPMDPFRAARRAVPAEAPRRIPRQIPDEKFDELFASSGPTGTGHWWRSGCPPAPGPRSCWAPRPRTPTRVGSWSRDPQGDQGAAAAAGLAGCVRVAAALPAADARAGGGGTRRPVVVDAAAAVPAAVLPRGQGDVHRAGAALGGRWRLHDLRHTAAYRMARDPAMPLTDVILSFRVNRGCDLRCPVVDSVADGTLAA